MGFPGCSSGKEFACQWQAKKKIPLGPGRSPGGGIATHSGMLAQRIPWKEESGRLKSMVLKPMELQKSWTQLSTGYIII